MKIKLTFIIFTFLYISIEAQQYGHWEITDSTKLPRMEHASIVMADGNVLVTGGIVGYNSGYSSTAEIYDVTTNTWQFICGKEISRPGLESPVRTIES